MKKKCFLIIFRGIIFINSYYVAARKRRPLKCMEGSAWTFIMEIDQLCMISNINFADLNVFLDDNF